MGTGKGQVWGWVCSTKGAVIKDSEWEQGRGRCSVGWVVQREQLLRIVNRNREGAGVGLGGYYKGRN